MACQHKSNRFELMDKCIPVVFILYPIIKYILIVTSQLTIIHMPVIRKSISPETEDMA